MKEIRRTIALCTVALTVFMMSGCGKSNAQANEPAAEAAPQQTEELQKPDAVETVPETAAPEITPEPTVLPFSEPAVLSSDYALSDYEAYHAVVNRYYYVANAQWSQDALAEAGLNYQVAFCYEGDPMQNVGYSLTDINGDNIPELMICPIYAPDAGLEPVIFEMYTLSGEEAVRVFSGLERDVYMLTESGMIYNRGSSGADHTTWNINSLNGTALQTETEIQYDGGAENGPWFCNTEPTDEASANSTIEAMENGIVVPVITPLADFS